MLFIIKIVAYAIILLILDTLRQILFILIVNKKVKHAIQRNKCSVCWSFLLTTSLLNLEVYFFNKLSAFLWERFVRLSLSASFYSHVSRSSFRHLSNKKIKEARSFNFTFRYIDGVLSMNNPNFSDWVLFILSSGTKTLRKQQTRLRLPHF